jgi:tol-pal system protein YbgF
MTFKIAVTLIFVFTFSCSGSDNLNKNEKSKKKNSEIDALFGLDDSNQGGGDDELLSLLEGNNKDKKPAVKTEFQSISDDKENAKKDTKEEEKPANDKKEEPVTKTNNSKMMDDGKAKDLEKRVKELEGNLNSKDNKIKSLESENQKLKSENQNLANRSPEVIYKTVGSASPLSNDEYKSSYDAAFQLFSNKQYQDAIQAFESLIRSNANHSLADNAQYWIGESKFGLKMFREAIIEFEKVFTYPKSNKLEDAQFKIGLCYYILKDTANAKSELQRFIDQYQNSRNFERAQKLISQL